MADVPRHTTKHPRGSSRQSLAHGVCWSLDVLLERAPVSCKHHLPPFCHSACVAPTQHSLNKHKNTLTDYRHNIVTLFVQYNNFVDMTDEYLIFILFDTRKHTHVYYIRHTDQGDTTRNVRQLPSSLTCFFTLVQLLEFVSFVVFFLNRLNCFSRVNFCSK